MSCRSIGCLTECVDKSIPVWSIGSCTRRWWVPDNKVVMHSSGLPLFARLCFALFLVNALLIAGTFVSALRRSCGPNVVSPSPETDKTKVPSAHTETYCKAAEYSITVNECELQWIFETRSWRYTYLESRTTMQQEHWICLEILFNTEQRDYNVDPFIFK